MRLQFSWSDAVRKTFFWLVAVSAAFVCQHKAYSDEPSPEKKLNSIVADELRTEAIAEMRIRKALLEPTVIEFVDTPLSDVLDFLEDQHGIQIELVTTGLDAVGLGSDSPVNGDLKGITLGSALHAMLKYMGLTYIIHDEILWITTYEDAEATTVNRIYNVADLLAEERTIVELAEVVTIATASHAHDGGNIVGFGKCLIATVSHPRQHSIARLLALLRATQTGEKPGAVQNPLGLFPVNEKQLALQGTTKRHVKAKVSKQVKVLDPFGEGVPAPGKAKQTPDPNRDPFGGGVGGADPFGGGNH